MKHIIGINEATCKMCGKVFIITDEWVYKRGVKKFCSWHCFNGYLNEIKTKKDGEQTNENQT
jgi:hypothetical protein